MLSSIKRVWGRTAAAAAAILVATVPVWAAEVGRLVVVGDSLGAGFQNFSLYDGKSDIYAPPGGQRYGFADFVARQADVSLNLPLIAYPGIPPVLTLQGNEITRAPGFGSRESQTLGLQTLDLSVPGFDVLDALLHKVNVAQIKAHPEQASFEDLLTVEILGYPSLTNLSKSCGVLPLANGYVEFSAAACAIQLRPNTILVSLGSDDALQALTSGIPPTPVAKFTEYYNILLAALSSTHAKIVVGNVPNVTDIPFLLSYPEFEARCGVPPSGAGPNDFVVPNVAATTFNVCTNYSVRSAALIATTETAVKDYNLAIAGLAAKYHAVVVDVNSLFARIHKNGYYVPGHPLLTAQYLGGIFSLDAVHPTNTGYAIMANAYIARMNCELGTTIPAVNIENVANTDPLVPR